MTDEQQSPKIDIGRDVNADVSVIGGKLDVGRDLNIHQSKPERTCPLPPNKPEQFGGREKPLETLLAKLKAGEDSAITAVRGMGGMGKTTLAKMLAYQLHADGIFRAVLWTEVTRTPDVLQLLRGWAKHADASFDTANQSEGQIALRVKALLEDVIAEKCDTCESPRVLVVLDDVWEESQKAVDLLKQACPDNSTILITTRSGRVANRIAPGEVEALDKMQADEAVKLLREYLKKKPSDAALQKLGQALEGHPLALKLAAYRVLDELERAGATLESTLERCTRDYETGIPAGASFADLMLEQSDDKDDNLTKSLYYSYEALTSEEQARFRALGILPAHVSFDTTILAALWELPPEQVEKACDALRLRALLDPDEAPGWYRQHSLLRSLARDLLAKAGETDAVFARYADITTSIGGQFHRLKQETWNILNSYLPHIHHIGDELLKMYLEKPDTIENMRRMGLFVSAISPYITKRPEMIFTSEGKKLRGLNWMEASLAVYRQQGNKELEAATITNIGGMWVDVSDRFKALNYYQQGLLLFQQANNKPGESIALGNIAGVLTLLRKFNEALNFYEQSLRIVQQLGDKLGEATNLGNIGKLWAERKEKPKALNFYKRALAIFRQIGEKSGEATTLSSMGKLWFEMGKNTKALEFYEQALDLHRQLGIKYEEAATLHNIGQVWFGKKEYHKALDFYEQALPLSQYVGNKSGEAAICHHTAMVWNELENRYKALDFYSRSLLLTRQINDKYNEAATLNNIAVIHEDYQEFEQAIEIYYLALHVAQQGEAIDQVASFHVNLGNIFQKLNRLDEAISHTQQAINTLKQYHLSQDASERDLSEIEAYLTELQSLLLDKLLKNSRK